MNKNQTIDFDVIKQAASGKWSTILSALTPLSAEVLTRGSKDHPCPCCNGASVIWPARDAQETGVIACRNCTENKPTGDGIATVAKFAGLSQSDAAKAIANLIGVDGQKFREQSNIIAEVCRAKRMPLNAFMQFEPTIAKRGRDRKDVARVPVYNESGEKHSYFDLSPQGKGLFQRGTGNSGLFLPNRLPQAGETWLLVEGVKDAACLIGLGYNACGLPTSCMHAKYARLFADCDVVTAADLDSAGQSGAQTTGGQLVGIAKSIRVARLPGEVVSSNGRDCRDILSQPGGEQLLRDAINNAVPWQPREGDPDPRDGRPQVLVTLNFSYVCNQVIRCIGKLGWETPWIPLEKRERLKVYQRGGSLVHVLAAEDDELLRGVGIPAGTPRILPLPSGQIPLRVTDACQLMQEIKQGGEIVQVPTRPEHWLVEGIATRGDWGNDVCRLLGVITAPTIRSDGTILQHTGYDAKSGLLYHEMKTKFPAIPNSPSQADAQLAASELSAVVKDFPFVDDADRSAWLALVLSLIGRPAIGGCVPLFAITANCRGSGKSLLADAASLIAYGRHAARKTYSGDDDETRKTITAIAIEALPSVLLDNLDRMLGGASLDAALTATHWTDRILQTNKTTGELPLRTVWMATGNNLRFGSDIARRVLPVRLAAMVENPEERTDFEHNNLLGWVADNRPRLAVAALTILRAYIVAGKPVQAGGVWGSYENWSALVRGAIVWTGFADPLNTRQTAKADDESAAIVAGLIGGLIEIDDTGDGLTTREIADQLNDPLNADRFPNLRDVVAEVATYRGNVDGRRLAYQLRKFRGRIAKGWQIDGKQDRNGVVRWTAKQVTAGDAGDAGDVLPQRQNENCVYHTHTHATHTRFISEMSESMPSMPLIPRKESTSTKCDCGSEMVPSPEGPVGNKLRYLLWLCPNCSAVKNVRL